MCKVVNVYSSHIDWLAEMEGQQVVLFARFRTDRPKKEGKEDNGDMKEA